MNKLSCADASLLIVMYICFRGLMYRAARA